MKGTALLLLAASALASAAAERTWTDSTGKFQVKAELIQVEDGTVVLRRANGSVVKVPLNRPSEKDRQFVAEHRAEGATDSEEEKRPIDRTDQFDAQPEDGVRIPIEIANPKPPIESIKEIRGSVKLRTGGRYEEAVVEDVKQHLNQEIKNELLEQAGISVRVSRRTRGEAAPTGGLQFGFGEEATETIIVDAQGKLEPLVRVEVVSPSGKPLDPMMSGTAGFGQQIQYTFGFANPIPATADLRLVLHLDAEELTVRFHVQDIGVPPVTERPGGFPGFPAR